MMVSLHQTYRVIIINDFGFKSLKKINITNNVPFKCIRKQIWPDIK